MKYSIIFNAAIAFLLFAFMGCNRPHTPGEVEIKKDHTQSDMKKPNDLKTIRAEIEEANKNLMSLVAAGDSVGIANMYTADAKLMFAGRPADVGRANIQAVFSRIINSGVTRINLDTKEVFGTGDLLAEEGEVTVYVKDAAVAVEKYIILWKKEDGKWKLFRDIANSNLPAK